MSAEAAFEVEGLGHRFGARRVLREISFAIGAGDFTVLLGLNGAGKTTLFSLATRLYASDEGVIRVFADDLRTRPSACLRQMGVVFQQPTLDLELSVTSNLLFHAGLHGIPRSIARTRIEKELARLGLADRAHDKTATLSGGNRRRIELARSLLHEPRVLLMDEATVGLDPASRSELLRSLLALRSERGVAVLWATHLCDEVSDADRVIVMHRGKVLSDTSPAELLVATGADSVEQAFLAMTGAPERV